MSRLHWILLFLWLAAGAVVGTERGVLLAVPSAELERHGFDAADSTALFVGVNGFDDPALASVPYAVDDAVDLAHLFAFDLALVAAPRVVLALSGGPVKPDSRERLAALKAAGARVKDADRSDIRTLLHRQSRAAGEKGLFLVGFATHGFTHRGEDYLFARDTLLDFPGDTGVPVRWLFEALSNTGTPRRFALLDACRERLGKARSGIGEGSPMGQTFHDAIASARGQVVLAATTTDGYAYDDPKRKNGVFTAAILDGLRGAAPKTAEHFVTAGKLADYVNRRVLDWVREHRPSDRKTQGITRNIEGAGAALPLAADPKARQRVHDYQTRRKAAMDKLKANLGRPLTGALYDRIAGFLDTDAPTDAQLELLAEIEELDGTRRTKRGLAAYVQSYVNQAPGRAEPPIRASVPAVPPKRSQPVQAARAFLTVRSNLRSDTLYIDGTEKGPTGPKVHEVAAGTHRVRVEKAGYVPWDETLELASGDRRTVRAVLEADIAPDLVRIEGGCFEMGSPEGEEGRDDDEPRHRVCVDAFELGRHEVTVGEFRRFVLATGHRTDAERDTGGKNGCRALDLDDTKDLWSWRDWASWRNPNKYQANRDDHPVACVSFDDAETYVAWLNRETGGGYRLPTEAEWEYAARAGTTTARYWGEDPTQACGYANVRDQTPLPNGSTWESPRHESPRHECSDGYALAAPVGRFRANAYGLHDMLGNLWEWTCSAYDGDYGGAETQCLSNNRAARRVRRGGSWSNGPRPVRAANRSGLTPGNRGNDIGFRLARTP